MVCAVVEDPSATAAADSSDSDPVIELQATENVIDTNSLKSFEHTKRPRRKKKKRSDKTVTSHSGDGVDDDVTNVEPVVDPYEGSSSFHV